MTSMRASSMSCAAENEFIALSGLAFAAIASVCRSMSTGLPESTIASGEAEPVSLLL